MQKLLTAIGVDKIERDSIADAIEDWRDANDTTRANGAESDDYYLKLPVPYRARNGNFQDTDELLQVKGITPEMYWGHDDKTPLADVLTARSRNTVNINTAPAPVLSALGLSDAEITDIVQTRTNNPYPTVPGRFTRARVTVGSTTFRIDAEGIVGGEPKARIVAIVQKAAASPGTPPTVTVVSWRPMPLRSPATKESGKS
jgi:general secretion pathway protein K